MSATLPMTAHHRCPLLPRVLHSTLPPLSTCPASTFGWAPQTTVQQLLFELSKPTHKRLNCLLLAGMLHFSLRCWQCTNVMLL
jgi:hypothetical protein